MHPRYHTITLSILYLTIYLCMATDHSELQIRVDVEPIEYLGGKRIKQLTRSLE